MKLKISTPYLLTVVLVGLALLLVPGFVSATTVGSFVAGFIATILQVFIWLLGKLLVLIIYLVVWVAQYNEFVTSPAVSVGWGIVRDICNMFFIVFLLIIAFCTILNIPNWELKSALPKLLLWAVLINFSKLICGVIIDVAQVFMLTFVNGFKDIAGGNFGSMFGIGSLLNVNAAADNVSVLGVAGTYILALAYILIALVVITIILAILVVRMVMLWIYVVLSPLAFLLAGTKSTSKHFDKWMGDFSGHVIAGPVLAFFVWMSFATMSSTTTPLGQTLKPNQGADAEYYNSFTSSSTQNANGVSAGLADAGTPDGMLKFVIAIGMLIGGVIITKSISGEAASIASKITDKSKKWGGSMAKSAGLTAANVGLRSSGAVIQKSGALTSKLTGGQYGGTLEKGGKFVRDWGKDIQHEQHEESKKKKLHRLHALGLHDQGLAALQDFSKDSVMGKMTAAALAGSPGEFVRAPLHHPKKLLGNQLQNFAVWRQGRKNEKDKAKEVEQTGAAVEERRAEMSAPWRKTHSDMKTYDENQKKETDDLMQSWDKDRSAAQVAGATPERLKEIDKEYDEKIDSTNARYNLLKINAHDDYVSKTTPEQRAQDENKKDAFLRATQYHDDAKKAATGKVDKKNELDTLNKTHKEESEKLKTSKEDEIKKAKETFKGAPVALASELKNIDGKYAIAEKGLNDNHAKKVKEVEGKYKPESTELTGFNQFIDKLGHKVDKMNTTKLTDGAIKKGLKEVQDSQDIVAVFGTVPLTEHSKSDFSSAKGHNGVNERVWKNLASGDPESRQKLAQVVEQLKAINAKGGSKEKKEREIIESIKKGLATQLKNNPGDKGIFAALKGQLDVLDTGHKEGKIKVEEFEVKGKGGHGHDDGDDHKKEDKGGHKNEHATPHAAPAGGEPHGEHKPH